MRKWKKRKKSKQKIKLVLSRAGQKSRNWTVTTPLKPGTGVLWEKISYFFQFSSLSIILSYSLLSLPKACSIINSCFAVPSKSWGRNLCKMNGRGNKGQRKIFQFSFLLFKNKPLNNLVVFGKIKIICRNYYDFISQFIYYSISMSGIHCYLALYRARFHKNCFTKSICTYMREVSLLEKKQQIKKSNMLPKGVRFSLPKEEWLRLF